jgi:ATP-dependent Zn protease
VPLAPDVDLLTLASTTPGLSGADLKNLVNEAALLAARRGQNDVRQKDFLDALEKIVLGPERVLLLSPDDRERIAYHESGHAILGLLVPGADPVNRVTIVPRGRRSGSPTSDRTTTATTTPRPICAPGSSACWAGARPRKWFTVPRPPVPRATSSRHQSGP